jgi:hypothetical protein
MVFWLCLQLVMLWQTSLLLDVWWCLLMAAVADVALAMFDGAVDMLGLWL